MEVITACCIGLEESLIRSYKESDRGPDTQYFLYPFHYKCSEWDSVPGADGWGRVGGSGQLSGGYGRTLTSRSRHGRLLGGGDV